MKRFANIYLFFNVLYWMQGVIYARGSIISRLLLLVIIAVSFYYFVYANTRFNLPRPLKILTILIVLWTIYGVVPIFEGSNLVDNSFEYLKNIYFSLLPIFCLYVFFKKQWLDEKSLRLWIFAFLIQSIVYFYSNAARIVDMYGRQEFTNNAGYVVVGIITLLPLLLRKPLIQYSVLFVCNYYVLIGFKRGAILVSVLCSIWLIYKSFKDQNLSLPGKGNKRIIRLILTVFIVLGIVFLVNYYLSTSDYFNHRIEVTREGDSSGRDDIYSYFWGYFFNQSNVLNFLFGNGTYATMRIGGVFAHNDWLELLIDNGLVMTVIYLLYWLSIFKMVRNMKKSTTRLMMELFMMMAFVESLFSMSFNSLPISASCAFAYSLANYERKAIELS